MIFSAFFCTDTQITSTTGLKKLIGCLLSQTHAAVSSLHSPATIPGYKP